MSFRDAVQWFGHIAATTYGRIGNPGQAEVPLTAHCCVTSPVAEGSDAIVRLDAEIRVLMHGAEAFARRRDCRLQFALQPSLAVDLEPALLRQALGALLRQAISRADSCVLVGGRREASRVRLTVCDDGSAANDVVVRFASGGAMQGLMAHGATLSIEVLPGRGTTVAISLPAAATADR